MSDLGSVRCGVVIVAGGSGVRFGADVPKQFLLLAEKPVLMHTIFAFSQVSFIDDIVVVLPAEHKSMWEQLCNDHQFIIPHVLAEGGKERFISVRNGLQHMQHCDVVGIHDGVRPIVSASLIENCFTTAMLHGSCVPVVPITDSLRRGDFSVNSVVGRENLYRVQTPQVFRRDWIMDAYKQPYDSKFTDDASVLESAGFNIILTHGDDRNIKITGKPDMELAEFYLSKI